MKTGFGLVGAAQASGRLRKALEAGAAECAASVDNKWLALLAREHGDATAWYTNFVCAVAAAISEALGP